ncbi:MAG: glycosyltransferase [Planctomycetota bacterium]
MTASRRCVAHLVRTFLAPSETFIHGQIVGAERWRPIVVARKLAQPERFHLNGHPLCATDVGRSRVVQLWAEWSWRARRFGGGEARRTAAALAAYAPSLVHAHFGTDARFFRPLWKRLDVPVIVSFYGYDAQKIPRRFGGLGARYLAPVLAESARLVAPSRDMAQDLERLGAVAARIEVLPWGVDTERIRPRLAPRAAGPVRFATACRFTEKKGVTYLISAFERVLRAGVEAELTLAGGGPLEDAYRAQVRALGIQRSVRFPGFLAGADLLSFLWGQDVFVLASVTAADGDKEGTPTVLMEAQAAGLPVVATRHGGIPDVVAERESLVAERDVDALAARMLDLAREHARWPSIGERGRAHVLAHFDARTQNQRREDLYDRVVEGR